MSASYTELAGISTDLDIILYFAILQVFSLLTTSIINSIMKAGLRL